MAKVSPFAPKELPRLPAIDGVRFATCAAGIRYPGRTDLLLALFEPGTTVAGVLTKSKTASAPVEWCRARLQHGMARALVVNSGNANAFTGKRGREAVKLTAEAAAVAADCLEADVYLASTCAGDDELRRQVERLLRSDEQAEAEAFLAEPALPDPNQQTAGLLGRQIGPYKLLRELGSGFTAASSTCAVALRNFGLAFMCAPRGSCGRSDGGRIPVHASLRRHYPHQVPRVSLTRPRMRPPGGRTPNVSPLR